MIKQSLSLPFERSTYTFKLFTIFLFSFILLENWSSEIEFLMPVSPSYITDAISDVLSHIINAGGLYGLIIFASGLVKLHRSIINNTPQEKLELTIRATDLRYAIYYLLISIILNVATYYSAATLGGGYAVITYILNQFVSSIISATPLIRELVSYLIYILAGIGGLIALFLLISFMFTRVYLILPRLAAGHEFKSWPEHIKQKFSLFSPISTAFAAVLLISGIPSFLLTLEATVNHKYTQISSDGIAYFVLSSLFQVYAVLAVCAAISLVYKKHILPEISRELEEGARV